jgi:hypothetical protein
MFSLFFLYHIYVNIIYANMYTSINLFFFSPIQKLLQAHAQARHQQQPLPHAKKTSLLLQLAHVVVLGPDPL